MPAPNPLQHIGANGKQKCAKRAIDTVQEASVPYPLSSMAAPGTVRLDNKKAR
jgi:hypothetical protein